MASKAAPANAAQMKKRRTARWIDAKGKSHNVSVTGTGTLVIKYSHYVGTAKTISAPTVNTTTKRAASTVDFH
jgi:hypothetical protein